MRLLSISILAVALLVVSSAAAQSADDIIGRAADARYTGNTVQTIELAREYRGVVKEYTLVTSTRVDTVEQTRAEFTAPADMQGMMFLTRKAPGAGTENWMYMSAVGSLTHITGTQRTGSFMGTDFSYEDLEIGDVDAGAHTLVGVEAITIDGAAYTCDKVATTPVADQVTAYGKIITWVEQGTSLPRRMLMFKKDGTTEYKRMTFEAWDGSSPGNYVPKRIRMEDLVKDASTLMTITDYRLDVPADELPDDRFDPTMLGQ